MEIFENPNMCHHQDAKAPNILHKFSCFACYLGNFKLEMLPITMKHKEVRDMWSRLYTIFGMQITHSAGVEAKKLFQTKPLHKNNPKYRRSISKL